MLKDKINKIYMEIVKEDESFNFKNSKTNICCQAWHRLNVQDRIDIMAMRTREYKTTKAGYNACLKIVENMVDLNNILEKESYKMKYENSGRENFREYEIKGLTVEELLNKYSKTYNARTKEYHDAMTKSHTEDLEKCGFTFVNHHDSITGDHVAIFK